KTERGVLDGQVECKNPRSDTVRYRVVYDEGVATGDVIVFSYDGEQRLAEGTIQNGQLNGAMALYSPVTGKVIAKATLIDNALHGKHEMFDEDTGQLTYSAPYVEGALDGEKTIYSGDGTLLYRGRYEKGIKIGVHEEFSET